MKCECLGGVVCYVAESVDGAAWCGQCGGAGGAGRTSDVSVLSSQ